MRIAHVFVDDYGCLDASQQELCRLVAGTSLTVTGDPTYAPLDRNPYAHPEGLRALLASDGNATCVDLGVRQRTARQEVVSTIDVKEEFEAIFKMVRDAENRDVPLDDIALTCANGVWRKNIARYLRNRGIPVDETPRRVRVHDFADAESYAAAARRTEELRATNPRDGVALRCAFGYGDHLARSAELRRLRESHPHATLAQLVEQDLVHIPQSSTPQPVPKRKDDAPGAHARVLVCAPSDLVGRRFDTVVFGGMLYGWVPDRSFDTAVGKRKQQLLEQAQRFIDYATRAADSHLAFTCFTEADLEFAEQLGLSYARSRYRNGVRTCQLKPSIELVS